MQTVPEASKIIIERSRYLSEALSKDLINLSSLARYIKPEIEEMLYKKVNNGSIIMALKRIKKDLKPKTPNVKIFKIAPQMSVLTGLFIHRLSPQKKKVENELSYSYITRSSSEIVIATSKKMNTENIAVTSSQDACALIIKLPENAQKTPGIHYFFLKSLAWEGINIIQTFSNSKEYVLFFSSNDIHRAFKTLTTLFSK